MEQAVRAVILALLLSGCSTFSLRPSHFPERVTAPTPEEIEEQKICDKMDNKQIAWTGTSIAFGVLAGAGGLTTAVFDDKTPRWAIGSVSLLLAVGMAVTSYVSKVETKRYSDRCTQGK